MLLDTTGNANISRLKFALWVSLKNHLIKRIFLIKIFIWKAEWQGLGGRGGGIFPLFVHSSNHCRDWERMKSGAMNSIWASHVDNRGPNACVIMHCFCKYINRDLNGKKSRQNSEQHSAIESRMLLYYTRQNNLFTTTLPKKPWHTFVISCKDKKLNTFKTRYGYFGL